MPVDLSPVDVLRAARALIEDQAKWCTGTLHCDVTGQMCALGAVARVVFGDTYVTEYASVARATPAVGLLAVAAGQSTDGPNNEAWAVVDFNDGEETAEQHAKVLDLFDRAIVLAEAA